MHYRNFGKTSWLVSGLGFGAAPLQSRVNRRQSLRALNVAFEGGINFYDTAPTYGQGGSETVLGDFFNGKRDKVFLCTKVGQAISPAVQKMVFLKQWVGPFIRPFKKVRKAAGKIISAQTNTNNYGADEIVKSVEGSLKRLRTDYLDLLMLHSPSIEVIEQGDAFATLEGLRTSGKIRGYGVAANTLEEAKAALFNNDSGMLCVQISLNVFETEGIDSILPLAQAKGVAVVARAPFANGRIFHATETNALHNLKPYEKTGLTRAQAAIAYVLDQKGVNVVLPSMTTEPHLNEALGVFNQCKNAGQTVYTVNT